MENTRRCKKTEDGRYKSTENLLEMTDRKKTELDSKRPLTEGEAVGHKEAFYFVRDLVKEQAPLS